MCSPDTGLPFLGMETFKPSTRKALSELILSAAATLASHFLSPAEEAASLTDVIFGRPCSESFAFFDPATSSWKTCQGTFLWDSDKFSETWPPAGTMRNGKCFLQPPWERRTSEDDSSLWRTPAAWNASQGPKSKEFYEQCLQTGESMITLTDQVRHTPRNWPTPTVYGNSNSPRAGTKRGTGLSTAAKMWPTPRASDGEKGSKNQRFGRGNMGLEAAVHHPDLTKFPTPTARDYRTGQKNRVKRHGTKHGSSNLNDVISGKLNPTWVEWLMGFPAGWTELSASAMQSFLKSRRKSAKG